MTTKKATKTVKRRKKSYWVFVNDIVGYLKSHFYLHSWTIRTLQMKAAKPESNSEQFSGEDVVASMGSDNMYMDATLRLYPLAKRMWKEGRYDALGRDIVHEFCHILTDPLYKIAINGVSRREGPNLEHVRENTTQQMANIAILGIDKSAFSPYKYTRKREK